MKVVGFHGNLYYIACDFQQPLPTVLRWLSGVRHWTRKYVANVNQAYELSVHKAMASVPNSSRLVCPKKNDVYGEGTVFWCKWCAFIWARFPFWLNFVRLVETTTGNPILFFDCFCLDFLDGHAFLWGKLLKTKKCPWWFWNGDSWISTLPETDSSPTKIAIPTLRHLQVDTTNFALSRERRQTQPLQVL